ncbi:hypothetical protein M3J09_003599 [Ascochyta lentis]
MHVLLLYLVIEALDLVPLQLQHRYRSSTRVSEQQKSSFGSSICDRVFIGGPDSRVLRCLCTKAGSNVNLKRL